VFGDYVCVVLCGSCLAKTRLVYLLLVNKKDNEKHKNNSCCFQRFGACCGVWKTCFPFPRGRYVQNLYFFWFFF